MSDRVIVEYGAAGLPQRDAAIPENILDEAAFWLMQLQEGPLDANRHARLAQWQKLSPEHERVWERASLLAEKFAGLPPAGVKALKCVMLPEGRKTAKILTGMLVAEKMPMSVFASPLNRYRTGVLQVDPRIADLAVSGAFPVGDTDLTLALLEQTMQMQMQMQMQMRYFMGFWVTLLPQ
jgi:ferric-dicitrate binding protein FerR (iron transport regulator)